MSFDPESLDVRLAVGQWAAVVGILSVLVVLVTSLTSFVAFGATGPLLVLGQMREGLQDFGRGSLRRIGAVTRLTIKESLRRKTLFVLVVFGILFLFAGWYLPAHSGDTDLQVKVFVSFVLTSISWLILPVVLLLACWGLPEGIKSRSLHTVVTKPIRRNEIVLGRILGFVLVGTGVLVIMGLVGYVWMMR